MEKPESLVKETKGGKVRKLDK